jgi:hypothetical protein
MEKQLIIIKELLNLNIIKLNEKNIGTFTITPLNNNTILNQEQNIILKNKILKHTSFLNLETKMTERIYCILNNIQELKFCPICNSNRILFGTFSTGYNKTCSKKCGLEYSKQTNIKKYGCENIFQNETIKNKSKKTCLERYGCENASQNKEIQNKIKKTCIDKFGCENPMQNKEVKEKSSNTNLKRYGTKTPIQNEIIKKKIHNTMIKRYGTICPLNNYNIKQKAIETNLKKLGCENSFQNKETQHKIKKTCVERYGTKYYMQKDMVNYHLFNFNYIIDNFTYITTNNKKALKKEAAANFFNIKIYTLNSYIRKNKEHFKGIKLNSFNMELEITKKILEMFSNDNDLITNTIEEKDILINDRKVLSGKELDIYIPKLNIAIEYNGIIFHSFGIDKRKMFNNFKIENLEKNNHLNKTNMCEEKFIKLFHINEDEWLNPIKQKIWLYILKQNIEHKLNKLNKLNETTNPHIIYIKELNHKEHQHIIEEFLENNSLEYNKYIFEELMINKEISYIALYDSKQQLLSLIYGYITQNSKNETSFNIIDICNNINYVSFNFTKKELINVLEYLQEKFKMLKLNYITIEANRRWNNIQDNIYETIGFKKTRIIKPNYFYFLIYRKTNVIFSKNKLKTKEKIINFLQNIKDKKIKELNSFKNLNTLEYNYNDKLSKTNNIYNFGFRRMYDSGRIKYVITL